MRYHLPNVGFAERYFEAREVGAHPFATLLDDSLESLLVKTCREGNQLVLGDRHDVVAEESRLVPQMIGPALVDHAYDLIALAGTHPISSDAHEHASSSIFV